MAPFKSRNSGRPSAAADHLLARHGDVRHRSPEGDEPRLVKSHASSRGFLDLSLPISTNNRRPPPSSRLSGRSLGTRAASRASRTLSK